MVSVLLLTGAFVVSFAVAAVTGASSVSVSMAPAVGDNSTGVLPGAFLVGLVGFAGAGAGVDTRKYAGTLASWLLTLVGSTGTAYLLYLASQHAP